MNFEQIIGQQNIKQHLRDMVIHNRLSHALLFLGKEGVGALPMAIAFAQYIVCEQINAQQSGANLFTTTTAHETPLPLQACGTCPSCIKAQTLVHPDIHFTFPVIPKKAGDKPISNDYIKEFRTFIQNNPYGNDFDWLQFIHANNKQGNITAEECNDIVKKLSLKSFESDFKILILWLPEYLKKEGNRLLKIIEEPPSKTLFILVAEDDSQILPTILSRCQLIKLPLLTDNDIIQNLVNEHNTNQEKAIEIAALAEGNYRKALQLLQNAQDEWFLLLRNWLNLTLKGTPAQQIEWIERMNELGREKQKQFLRYFIHLIAQSIRLQFYDSNTCEKEKDFASKLNKLTDPFQQEAIITELEKATYYIERNANAKMLFHALTIKLKYIIKNKALLLTS